jgi:hypothetical protein
MKPEGTAMSLEQQIEQLNATVKELTAVMITVTEGQAANREAIEQLVAGGGAKAAPKSAPKAASKAASKPKEEKPKEEKPKAAPKPKEIDYTTDEGFNALKKICVDYLGVDDAVEKEDRGNKFEACLNKLGAPKLGAVKPGDRAQLAEWVKTLAAGEDLPEVTEEEEDGASSLLD